MAERSNFWKLIFEIVNSPEKVAEADEIVGDVQNLALTVLSKIVSQTLAIDRTLVGPRTRFIDFKPNTSQVKAWAKRVSEELKIPHSELRKWSMQRWSNLQIAMFVARKVFDEELKRKE